MAIKYSIARWSSMFAQKALEHVECARAPKAHDELYRLVYEMLANDGMLDRPVVLRLMDEVLKCEVSPPDRGHYRTQTFYLRIGDGAHSDYVEFRAERV